MSILSFKIGRVNFRMQGNTDQLILFNIIEFFVSKATKSMGLMLRSRISTTATTTDKSTTAAARDTTSKSTRSWATFDELSLLHRLAESGLKVDSTREVGIFARGIVDKEYFGLGWGRWHFDNLLVDGIGSLGEHVDESLLLGRRNNNGSGTSGNLGSPDEDEVVMHFGVWKRRSGSNLDLLSRRCSVQVDVASYLENEVEELVQNLFSIINL